MIKKILSVGLLSLLGSTFFPKTAKSCSSAIPMGRGGTNVAIADDSSATYWNPAGLIQLKRPELEYTQATFGYLHFISYAQPINEDSAFGFVFTERDAEIFEPPIRIRKWFRLSYSKKLNDKLSFGITGKIEKMYDIDGKVISPKQLTIPTVSIGNTFLSADLGILYKATDKIKFGILLQGMWNIRPGFSYKFNDNLMFTLEGYDIGKFNTDWDGNKRNLRHIRGGLEAKITKNFSLRTGFGKNNKDTALASSNYKTFGASINSKDFEFSIAYMDYGFKSITYFSTKVRF